MKILDVKIQNLTEKQAKRKVAKFLNMPKTQTIFTPNPEMLVAAHKDQYFKDILNEADLNIPDGFGIRLWAKEKVHRITGVDFFEEVCSLAEEKDKSVYLLGSGSEKVLAGVEQKLKKNFPNLRIAGKHIGSKIAFENTEYGKVLDLDEAENEKIIDEIIDAAPDVLFVALGHEKQEKWIYKYKEDLPSVKLAMGIGGTFDFYSGKVRRAPKWMRRIGMEWFFRLITQPWRVKRIFTALVVFSWLVNFSKEK